ncbi:MAG: sugar kinase [Lentilitoribacter sp.]
MKIACVGEAMIELSVDPSGRNAAVGYAGDTLNTAIYLKRNLQAAGDVYFTSVLGQDQFSDWMLNYIKAEDVDCATILRHDSLLPGIYSISKNEEGDRTFTYWRENSAARTLFKNQQGIIDFSPLSEMDVVYFSAITLAILPQEVVEALFKWLEGFRAGGGKVAFDSNYRPRLWPSREHALQTVEQAWRLTDIAVPSIDDEMELFEDVDENALIERFQSYQIKDVVIKRGERGPIALIDGKLQNPDIDFPPASSVVDTTAAGDSFNGGFFASFLAGAAIEPSMLAGHNMAMKVIAHQGAIIDKSHM